MEVQHLTVVRHAPTLLKLSRATILQLKWYNASMNFAQRMTFGVSAFFQLGLHQRGIAARCKPCRSSTKDNPHKNARMFFATSGSGTVNERKVVAAICNAIQEKTRYAIYCIGFGALLTLLMNKRFFIRPGYLWV